MKSVLYLRLLKKYSNCDEEVNDLDIDFRISRQGFKVAMISMLRTLIEKVDNVQEQMVNKSKKLGTLRKN